MEKGKKYFFVTTSNETAVVHYGTFKAAIPKFDIHLQSSNNQLHYVYVFDCEHGNRTRSIELEKWIFDSYESMMSCINNIKAEVVFSMDVVHFLEKEKV